MKKGATAMYGPKAMIDKEGPMAMKPKGPMAMGVRDADTEDMPVVDREKGTTAMKPKGPMAKQTSAEHYAMNAQHDIKTGEGTKADIMYDVKKASQYGYNSSVKKAQPHKH